MTPSKLRPVGRTSDQRESPRRQQGSVGHLQELFISEDPAFDEVLRRTLPPKSLHYAHIAAEEAPRALRSEVPADVEIDYWLYHPPGFWGDRPYSILRLQLLQLDHQDMGFFSHVGEELLYTSDPGFMYAFFDPRNPGERENPKEVPRGRVFRVRPQIPHRNFRKSSTSEEGLKAWIILHSMSGSMYTNAYAVEPEEEDADHEQIAEEFGDSPWRVTHRTISREELSDPSTYAINAWGLAEQIRWQRQKAGLTINQLAEEAGLNASFLSRVERGASNISFDNLRQIAAKVGLNLTEIGDAIEAEPFLKNPPAETHWLHPQTRPIRQGQSWEVPHHERLAGDCSSYIVANGEVVFQIVASTDAKPMKEIVTADGVIHLRKLENMEKITFTALEDSTLVEIRYSARCSCEREESTARSTKGRRP